MRLHLPMTLLALCLSAIVLFTSGSAHALGVSPAEGPLAGGIDVAVNYPLWTDTRYRIEVTFAGVPATDVRYVVVLRNQDTGAPELVELHCTVPPGLSGGAVDVVVNRVPSGDLPPLPPRVYPGAFTYLATPVITGITPSEFTYKNDQRRCKISGAGFPLVGTPKVMFGDRAGTNAVVRNGGTELWVTPPPFPGGEIPLVVDVTVVSGGIDVVFPGSFSYARLSPKRVVLSDSFVPAWRNGLSSQLTVEYFAEGNIYVYLNYKLVGSRLATGVVSDNSMALDFPALPPGRYDLRIVNGDGGETILENRINFYGEAEARFHTADRDQNYQLNLVEILRVIQLYNLGSLHCDETSEDGYAPGGGGEQSCAAHSSDFDPQDWKISLPELMELIQFYNLNCYKPCDIGSGFCPPA